jgi:hypothetical protein
MYVLPDVVPLDTEPVIDVQMEFTDQDDNKVRFEHGKILPVALTVNPPTVHMQCFHKDKRLYTLLMVDPGK